VEGIKASTIILNNQVKEAEIGRPCNTNREEERIWHVGGKPRTNEVIRKTYTYSYVRE
jgi:hypothetical protein